MIHLRGLLVSGRAQTRNCRRGKMWRLPVVHRGRGSTQVFANRRTETHPCNRAAQESAGQSARQNLDGTTAETVHGRPQENEVNNPRSAKKPSPVVPMLERHN